MGYKEELQVIVAENKDRKEAAAKAYDRDQTTDNYEILMKAIKDYKRAEKSLRSWS
jgi:hypothetical protein